MRPIPLPFLAALLTLPGPAWPAQTPLLEPGARVRVHTPSLGGRLTGTLLAWEADTLVMRVDGEGPGLIVPRQAIDWIEVRGERAMTLEGMGVGILGGALLAIVASPEWGEDGDCGEDWTALPCLAYEVSPRVGTRVAVLGLLGALVGGLAGSGVKTDTWTPVRLERVEVGAARSGGGGLALGVSISF